jgi:AcrR family transcriptional regulator
MTKTNSLTTKGIARREQLVDAALRLLERAQPNEISLQQIATEAGMPASSAYHFFSNSDQAFATCAERFGASLFSAVAGGYTVGPETTWQSLFCEAVDRGVALYVTHPAYCKLILGPYTPAEIKLADRENDAKVGSVFIAVLERHFVVFRQPRLEEKFFYAVEIIDLFLSMSFVRHNRLTPEMVADGKAAAVAYLEQYLPKILPKRERG